MESETGGHKVDEVELSEELKESYLYNKDLAPTKIKDRTWGTYNYAALWIGMSHCIPTYMLASGLIEGGMSWKQAVFTIMLGNLIVLLPMLLNSYAGAKYGIPFPVLCRSSFGVLGANIPAVMRAIVACGWFGIQTWIGGEALFTLILSFLEPFSSGGTAEFFIWLKLYGPWLCFFVFWFLNMIIIWRGMESVRHFENWAAPVVLVIALGLLWWAVKAAKGFGPILNVPSKFDNLATFFPFFIINLTGMVGYWATLSLNMPDFTRFSKSQTQQMLGQTLGLPTTMTFFAALGVLITSATVVIYGKPIWDPIQLLANFKQPIVVIISLFTIAVATLSVNVAANIVSPSFDFSNLWPKRISFKIGGTITGIIGILMMPWKLLKDYGTYIFGWLVGYSAFLGPIAGILICDFWLIRRRRLALKDLYDPEGAYGFRGKAEVIPFILLGALIAIDSGLLLDQVLCRIVTKYPSICSSSLQYLSCITIPAVIIGFILARLLLRFGINWKAVFSLFLGITAALVGLVIPGLKALYSYAWFVGFAVSFVSYLVLMSFSVRKIEAEETADVGLSSQ
ncbi:MAG: NCS1 family nucleobase:cation symporter-1 [Firmicutes bacterium]|nr:NCS1 family nucleobase:cation symporter-1 [Bacillota bacterium]